MVGRIEPHPTNANVYDLYITSAALQAYCKAEGHNQSYRELLKELKVREVSIDVFAGTKLRYCVVSFTSDWLYSSTESRKLVRALNAAAASVSFTELESDKGHDSFLLDLPEFESVIRGFINGSADLLGVD